ncbi:hypothetical protein [Streptomyces sp. NBC_00019]|uniref:hypothetical protein n=1 Tax=Streptomyces sp. NBC_00019 TaxID=2975623 RepID=UPI00324EA135
MLVDRVLALMLEDLAAEAESTVPPGEGHFGPREATGRWPTGFPACGSRSTGADLALEQAEHEDGVRRRWAARSPQR